MGLVIDNTTTRARPLPDRRPAFGLLCILAFYVPDFGTTGKLLYAFVTYLCLSFLYTGEYSVLRHAAVLTSDSAERTTLSAVRICWAPLAPPSSPWLRCRWSAC